MIWLPRVWSASPHEMRFDIVTLFPEMFDGIVRLGVVGRAAAAGLVSFRFKSPREFGHGAHKSVDDAPYGGGPGMVMRVDCLVACLEAFDAEAAQAEADRARRILLTPQGAPLSQARAHELGRLPAVALVCGRYQGVDERVRAHVDEELSLGDFVLSGGEIAAMAVIDCVARLVPGVLGNRESLLSESHHPDGDGLLEHPQYTRPPEFRGERVPEVLQSGDHAAIAAWRREQARARTAARRPDLLSARQASRRANVKTQ